MMAAVPDADVVVTNPTHFAVALSYDGSRTAPEVVAKGKDLIAAQIRRMAEENDVPVIADPPLARALYASVEIGQVIPEELYAAVARVLAFVYRLAGRSALATGGSHREQPRRAQAPAPHRLLAAVPVVMVVTMLVVPLPSALLDLLITINIAGALTIVAATMYLGKALDFASFPSLLLLTTMFRLAINVSVTRLILTTGDAGSVVKSFGEFVVGGNVVVGLVIFLILVVIQFVVVTNGAGRVAEVGARFTLDAMPGKQMAIDADLNAGLITDEQARERRAEIAREADFYGAMDGASKFVKGDAMAALIITGDQPRRRDRRRHAPAPPRLRRSHPPVLAADRRRRPRRADAGALDLGRHRHHRHARRLRPRPRLGHRQPGPRSAQGAARRRRRDRHVRADPRPAEAAVPADRGDLRRDRVGRAQRAAGRHRRGRRRPRRRAGGAAQARDEPMSEVGVDALELAIGFGLVPLVDGGSGGGSSLLRRVSVIRRQIAADLGS